MVTSGLNLNESPPEDDPVTYVMLERDDKPICLTRCVSLPFEPQGPMLWQIWDFQPKAWYPKLGLPHCQLYPEPQKSTQKREWGIFTEWLRKHNMVGIVKFKSLDFFILPPYQGGKFPHVDVCFRKRDACFISDCEEVRASGLGDSLVEPKSFICASLRTKNIEVSNHKESSHPRNYTRTFINSLPCDYFGDCTSEFQTVEHLEDRGQKIHMNTNPGYLKTLGQAHAWTFGAIAELVDNSRDARAIRLDICIESLYLKQVGKQVPVLSIIDDGHGMSHKEMMRMLSLGHRQPDEDDPDHIGRFGVGFKTGAMKLGKDVVVLTQTSTSRSIALFSQSFNENKDNMEIPIISYCRHGNYMEVDLQIQSEICASNYLKDVKEFSPFNEYFIGEKFKLIGEQGTGTQIYIWNLDKWGSDYTLEWDIAKAAEGTSSQRGDILIRSRRLRSRPGQISQKVPLDYSLKAYLEVIFLDPRMKIYVQGSLVRSRLLAKSLSRTMTVKGHVMGKPIQLTLGRSHKEWKRVNCGMFLYWHGRLIEKRGCKTDKPDHDWVQCDKCRKWRMLSAGFDTKSLPEEWFCYMPPFNGKCDTPEQQVEPGVVTVSAKRSRGNPEQVTVQCEETEMPDCNSSPSGGNNQIATQPRCNKQQKPVQVDAANQRSRNCTLHIKGRQSVNSSLADHKNTGKGESKDKSWKDNSESPPQRNLIRLRRGLPRNYNWS